MDRVMYAARFTGGIVKIGCTYSPSARRRTLHKQALRHYGAAMVEFVVGRDVPDHHWFLVEREILVAACAVAKPLPGRQEWFRDLPFGRAVELVGATGAGHTARVRKLEPHGSHRFRLIVAALAAHDFRPSPQHQETA